MTTFQQQILEFCGPNGEYRAWWQVSLATFLREWEARPGGDEVSRRYTAATIHLEAVADAILAGEDVSQAVLADYLPEELELFCLLRRVEWARLRRDEEASRGAIAALEEFTGHFGEKSRPIWHGLKVRVGALDVI